MERITLFVDILLPVPIPGTFTYRVPFDMNEAVTEGKRVVVQFGKKKLYSGLIKRIHQEVPDYPNVKYILDVLDAEPIVTNTQFRFWDWMADYYMATPGEVMNAALPTALKLASETKVVLNPSWDKNYEALNDKEFLIVQALEMQNVLTLTEVSSIVDQIKVLPLVKTLIEKGAVLPEEEMKSGFKPKMESYVRLAADYNSEEALQSLTQLIEHKAPKQLALLMAYLQRSNWFSGEVQEVNKAVLLKKAGISAAILSAMQKKGYFEIYEKSTSRLLDVDSEKEVSSISLNQEQANAVQAIEQGFEEKNVILLHGITGSGKTEVYIKLIEKVIAQGEQVLFLLPEIALTAQIINRLRKYFGKDVGVYHSRYNQNERVEVWNKVLGGVNEQSTYKIIIGARSAVFLPYSNLGLVIVDEEHDTSYKQYDPAPRYQARDAAIYLAMLHKAPTLLGSATPSIESYYKARKKKFGFVELTKRYSGISLPEVLVVDIAKARKQKEMKSHFSSFLLKAMEESLEKGEQIILFQNRRGFSLRLVCDKCQWTPECRNCDVTLTYHKQLGRVKCHYCGYTTEVPKQCPECGSKEVRMQGFGTEKIEDELPIFFPDKQIQRMDLDTTRSKNAFMQIINDFQDRRIDILVGTQMVTKGLDFDNVGLVGVLNADNMLMFPDFRSFEYSFQQLTQVSGRAGRKHKRGKVIIQTSQPYHDVIRNVIANEYFKMYESQMIERINFKYPPIYRLIKISLKHRDYHILNDGAKQYADMLRPKLGNRVLGPEYPHISRIKNMYIKNIMIKFEVMASVKYVKDILSEARLNLLQEDLYKSLRVQMDVDPV
jgi:primosomal protein N' (replication factor Y)